MPMPMKKKGKGGPNTGELAGCMKQKMKEGKHHLAAQTACAMQKKGGIVKTKGKGMTKYKK